METQTTTFATPITELEVATKPHRRVEEMLFSSLTEKGLDRLTDSRVEHVICTSALAAFN